MRSAMMMGIALAMSVSSWARIGTPDSYSQAPRARSHKYVNTEYGISFLYPDTYNATVADDRCQSNYYRRYLLCLAPVGGSDPVIYVSVIVAEPFHVSPGSGDVMPTRQRIGGHVFYCGVVGSMGVGFSDSCVLNLKGKTLQFQFNALDGINVDDKTKQLETTMLKTLRIF
jgi:hypothetical protein